MCSLSSVNFFLSINQFEFGNPGQDNTHYLSSYSILQKIELYYSTTIQSNKFLSAIFYSPAFQQSSEGAKRRVNSFICAPELLIPRIIYTHFEGGAVGFIMENWVGYGPEGRKSIAQQQLWAANCTP